MESTLFAFTCGRPWMSIRITDETSWDVLFLVDFQWLCEMGESDGFVFRVLIFLVLFVGLGNRVTYRYSSILSVIGFSRLISYNQSRSMKSKSSSPRCLFSSLWRLSSLQMNVHVALICIFLPIVGVFILTCVVGVALWDGELGYHTLCAFKLPPLRNNKSTTVAWRN